MNRLVPRSRMGIFTIVLAAIWMVKMLFFSSSARRSLPLLSFFLDLLPLLLAIPAVYYLWKLFKCIRNRMLWKIKRRLILAHIFIGAIPILLVIGIFYVSFLGFYYQFSYYLITNQIGIHSAQIHAFNLSLREGLQDLFMRTGIPGPAAIQAQLDSDSKYLLSSYPSASIILGIKDSKTNRIVTYMNQDSGERRIGEYQIPGWIGDREFHGLIVDDTRPQENGGRLLLRSLVPSDFQHDFSFTLEVSVPLDQYLLGRLKAAMGADLLLAGRVERPGIDVILQNTDIIQENILYSTFETESTQLSAGPPWHIFLFPISWTDGVEKSTADTGALLVELSTSKLMRNLFRSESTIGRKIWSVLKTIFFFFLIVEIASIVVGILLTKSITDAVHNLDRGTEFVKRGDFSHRIIVRSEDQLGALANSFNQMTEYVQHLVKERVQKERLERELEIAKEVQERLFPNRPPHMDCMDVAGICLPARTVSGDYYDFLPLGSHELGLALGDICGKGISAALLMANLQATLRSNVLNLRGNSEANGEKMVSEVVERLNSQIYGFTAANKFATFFFALYNDQSQTLTYCNAGHNPPLYLNGGSIRRLNAGGTVVGVFADSKYEQETIHAKPGDLFVAYTDGIVESVNEFGEEYGEYRLTELVDKNRHLDANAIKDIVVRQVLSWTFAEERDDDMTLIVAKIVGPHGTQDSMRIQVSNPESGSSGPGIA
ncbi:MAG: PP2C family protein-serine/threonine phosphatase [Acidobacteria bacterium]|nr:PP2C family protein-serine/threonine phosphatase [Acidobacteriota bacterium]